MATKTFRGRAQVAGCPATFDVILYPVQQNMSLTQEFDEEIIKDADGQDAAWRAQNEKYMGDMDMKLIADTQAHAEAGAAFLGPLAIVTVTLAKPTAWNSTFQVVSGGKISTKNDAVGDNGFRVRRYADSTQNTLAAATPS
jgi:hypothetical protein